MEKQKGERQCNRQRLNIWHACNLLEVMWSQLMGDTRRQSPIMLVWGLLARLIWADLDLWLCCINVCVFEQRGRRVKRERDRQIMRDGRESGREQSHFVVTACLMMEAAGSLKVLLTVSPCNCNTLLLLLPHSGAEINTLTCVIHH